MEHIIEKKLRHIFALLKEAKFIEVMHLYMHKYVVVQEADEDHVFGKSTCLRIKKIFIDHHFEKLIRYDIGNYAINGNHSFYDAVVEYTLKDGSTIILEQTVATKWRDGKIFRERYYHTPIKKTSLNTLKKDPKQEVSK